MKMFMMNDMHDTQLLIPRINAFSNDNYLSRLNDRSPRYINTHQHTVLIFSVGPLKACAANAVVQKILDRCITTK